MAAALADFLFPVVFFMAKMGTRILVAKSGEAGRKRRRKAPAVRMGIVHFHRQGAPYLSMGQRDLRRPIFIGHNGEHLTLHVERVESNRHRPRRPLRTRNEEATIKAWRNFRAHQSNRRDVSYCHFWQAKRQSASVEQRTRVT